MKKLAHTSMTYMIIGLISGIYFRELTRVTGFKGDSQLGLVHTHTLILGMFFFLIVLLLEKNFQLTNQPRYKLFYATYNSGLGITVLMMLIHGTMTVRNLSFPAALSGIAGLGHIMMTVGLGFFFTVLFASIKD